MERVPGQGIGDHIVLTLDVDELAIKSGELLHPSGLPTRQILLCGEIQKCFMIGVNVKRGTQKVRLPFAKGADNGQEFFLVRRVVELSILHGLQIEGNWPGRLPGRPKGEHRTRHSVASVSSQENLIFKWSITVKHLQDTRMFLICSKASWCSAVQVGKTLSWPL
jgi:hypothetical protein